MVISSAHPVSGKSSLKLLPGKRKRESIVSISTPFEGEDGGVRWLILPHVEACAVVSGLLSSRKLSVFVGESRMVIQ